MIYFDIALNRSNAGDARNMVAMVALSRTTAERSSFQDDFRQIALMVGSQLESGRLLSTSATAIRDAAIATEDELSGVNLDEEAGKLWSSSRLTRQPLRFCKLRAIYLIRLFA